MSIFQLENVSISYSAAPLLDRVNLVVNKNERVCLIGRNGAGKSTLLNVIAKNIVVDDGKLWYQSELKIGMLNQNLPPQDDKSVFDVVASGLQTVGNLLKQYYQLSINITTEKDMSLLEDIQHRLEALDGWGWQQKVDSIIKRLELDPNRRMSELSGGWRRRVDLAKVLVLEPDLLLLDEPTNHLDVVAVSWLDSFLKEFNGAIVFITHDRSFLQSLATRIVELDRGKLVSWNCDYKTFLERKAHSLEVEQEHQAQFDKKLAQEEVWIRQGIKARRTRNEGRVRALESLREQRQQRREQQGKAKFSFEQGQKSGKIVLEAKSISKQFNQKNIIQDFSTRLVRGDKVGLIGANGAGKSTLINILLDRLLPDSGTVSLGTRLDIAYFDQLRDQLDLEKTVIDNVAEGRESIEINGNQRHVIGYLGDFLFPPQRCRVPVKALSGGEKNRLLLARLFSKPTNVLVLDEPTNDLDVETLELLESLLVEYQGTLLLVSHDRVFLDNVVTSTFVFYPNGKIREYVGGFNDWLSQGGNVKQLLPEPRLMKKEIVENKKTVKSDKKMSYKLQKELEGLPSEIERLEARLAEIEEILSRSDFYDQDPQVVQDTLTKFEQMKKNIDDKMSRWEELENQLV